MKKQSGFTLIELVIVIVILGILAVTAAPKFLNLQGDARKSVAEGAEGAIKAAAELVYSKAIIAGLDNAATGSVKADGEDITTAFGYPTADDLGVALAVELEGTWSANAPSGAEGTVTCEITGSGTAYPDSTCTFFYRSGDTSDKCVIGYRQPGLDTEKATTGISTECGN